MWLMSLFIYRDLDECRPFLVASSWNKDDDAIRAEHWNSFYRRYGTKCRTCCIDKDLYPYPIYSQYSWHDKKSNRLESFSLRNGGCKDITLKL